MSLMSMGVTSRDVQQALERVKLGSLGWHNNTRSQNTYIVCPNGATLWDLKPVVGLVWEQIDAHNRPREWETNTFQKDLLTLGFAYVKFRDRKMRTLGIIGCDLSELNAPHTVFWPDGLKVDNGFACEERSSVKPNKRTSIVNRHIRNSTFAQQVKTAAGGVCDACGSQTFLTPWGEPFLEVHHKHWLSEGGLDEITNMVALCPTCHRQEHHGTQRKYR